MKVMVVFGTRPESIKLAPVIRRLKTSGKEFETIVCVTAQHREMLNQVLKYFEIKPDYDLNIIKDSQSLFDVTTRGLRRLERVLKKEKPGLVLVQGDTTTTFLASLAAYYLKIKLGHVEAGLRTHDKFSPFPEEINRRFADSLADLHFAATQAAKNNLIKEGICEKEIFVTGNTVIDALLMVRNKVKDAGDSGLNGIKDLNGAVVKRVNNPGRRMILVTGHRRESFGPTFESICNGLKKIVRKNENVEMVYPVHLNPNVRKPVMRILGNTHRIHLIEPIDYPSFVWLMDKSYLILTDSGGVQEEAPSLGKPVLVMRDKTDRPEAVEAGTAKVIGTDSEAISKEAQLLLDGKEYYRKMAQAVNPYGDGRASERIVEIISSYID